MVALVKLQNLTTLCLSKKKEKSFFLKKKVCLSHNTLLYKMYCSSLRTTVSSAVKLWDLTEPSALQGVGHLN